MYMGSHNSASQIRVLQWPDNSTNISWSDVNVRPWLGGAYSATGSGSVNWLARLDPRITGAWVSGGTIGFMWSANRDSSHPLPYIRVARIRETNKTLIDEPDIWSQLSHGLTRRRHQIRKARSESAPSMAAARAIPVASWA